jgi:hypothetical protein
MRSDDVAAGEAAQYGVEFITVHIQGAAPP